MKLEKFKAVKLDVAKLEHIFGGIESADVEAVFEDGETKSEEYSTKCTGSDRDGRPTDSD